MRENVKGGWQCFEYHFQNWASHWKTSICPYSRVHKNISYTFLISFFLAKLPRPRSGRSRAPYGKENWNLSIHKKEVQSKADHNNGYCFFKTIFWLAIPAFFNKPDNMQDRRPRFLRLISFSNLSMPENLVMTSSHSVHPYRLSGRGKKNSVGWGREFQTYVCCISFWRKKQQQQQRKHLETTNRVAGVNLLCSP